MTDVPGDPNAGGIVSLRFVVPQAVLTLGDHARLAVVAEDAAGRVLDAGALAWTSSAPNVVTVEDGGRVFAHALGVARVSVEAGGLSAEASLTVSRVGISSLGVHPTKAVICVGERLEVDPVFKDQSGVSRTPRLVEWSSSDAGVAVVSQEGWVTPVAPGSVRLTASSSGFTATATVDVVPARVGKLVLTPLSLTLEPGATEQLKVQITSPRGTPLPDVPVSWSSSDEKLVAVDATGGLRALAPGVAKITVTCVGTSSVATVRVIARRPG